ncbi:arsenic metallochaperone ArsD family protein [Rhodoblastus acidophilus]|uniref:Arsenic metallochaperone ArsD family protein n=1 Tax=Rhodoblastus acidophilus TaxID=1074 RepID=A0A6N8DU69_RHOAC|nr:thioredoxin family protein [Rhodoblastus acidophilus]MCW2276555.1 small redox-active disulfide protein 2 [Rhodoblastus acidophilus]MTV33356.1 arsenic metallochaperone ArsD family protein [Rhodoblastus acidophilus]
MKKVQVVGPGCKRCEATFEMLRSEARKLGTDVVIEKVTDYVEIARFCSKFGIVSTPVVVVDGKIVHAGGMPKAQEVAKWLGS